MRSEKGRTFDPVVLEVFFDMIDSLEAQLPELRTQPVSASNQSPPIVSLNPALALCLGRRLKRRCAI